jgi:hypothetical protein
VHKELWRKSEKGGVVQWPCEKNGELPLPRSSRVACALDQSCWISAKPRPSNLKAEQQQQQQQQQQQL